MLNRNSDRELWWLNLVEYLICSCYFSLNWKQRVVPRGALIVRVWWNTFVWDHTGKVCYLSINQFGIYNFLLISNFTQSNEVIRKAQWLAMGTKEVIDIKIDDLSGGEVIVLLEEHLADMYATSPPESVHAPLTLMVSSRQEITFFSAWKRQSITRMCCHQRAWYSTCGA